MDISKTRAWSTFLEAHLRVKHDSNQKRKKVTAAPAQPTQEQPTSPTEKDYAGHMCLVLKELLFTSMNKEQSNSYLAVLWNKAAVAL